MTDSYILLSYKSETGLARLERMCSKIIPNKYKINPLSDTMVLLVLNDGPVSTAIFKASFSALLVDNDDLSKALIIPCNNPIFYSYLELVKPQEIVELFKLAKDNKVIYYETYDLIASLDQEIIETLLVYLENNCSPLLSSYALYVHKNTVTYRINLFTKKTGLSLDSFANQMYLYGLITSREIEEENY